MTIDQVRRDVAKLRDGVLDPNLKAVLTMAAVRLTPRMQRVTLEWIALMLRDEGNRAACQGRDDLGAWLTDTGLAVQDLWTDYHG